MADTTTTPLAANDPSLTPSGTQDPNATSDQMLNAIVQRLLTPQSTANPLTDVGGILGNAAKGQLGQTNITNAQALQGGGLSNQLYQSALQRALAQAALPNFRAQQAVTGDQIANVQDVVPTGPANVMAHVINYTGGKRPSNLGPNARAAGAALSNIGASNIGKDVLPAVPNMPTLQSGGALGGVLGGGSLAASLIGALAGKSGGGSPGGGGSSPSGGSMDLSKLFAGLLNKNASNPYGGTTVTGDPSTGSTVSGPAGGGITPGEQYGLPQGGQSGSGMQAYYDWLAQQQGGGGDPNNTGTGLSGGGE